jgi:hypothetical protein
MKSLDELKAYCEYHGYTSRACRFKVIQELVGITEEEAKSAEKICRYLRQIFPPDKISHEKTNQLLDDLGYGQSIYDLA